MKFEERDWDIYRAKYVLRHWDFYENHITELTEPQKIRARAFFIRLSYLTNEQRKWLRKKFYGCGKKDSNIKGELSEQEKILILKFGEYHGEPMEEKKNQDLIELIKKLKESIET